jgi:hypothetical protein
MQALFDAVDITGVTTNVSTLLIGFIGIGLLFLGYAYVKRTMHASPPHFLGTGTLCRKSIPCPT